MSRKNNILSGFAYGAARYVAYQTIRDLKKEFNLSLVPSNSKLTKAIRDFEIKGFKATVSRLIGILDMIECEWEKDKSTNKMMELREAISFVNSKIAVIEYQIVTELDDSLMHNLNSYYSKVKNSLK